MLLHSRQAMQADKERKAGLLLSLKRPLLAESSEPKSPIEATIQRVVLKTIKGRFEGDIRPGSEAPCSPSPAATPGT